MTLVFFIGALIDRFARFLEHLHARSPFVAFLVAMLIAALCTIALALPNQDGPAVSTHLVRNA
ncbi:hypothetical protein C3E98_030070 [Pseudomonas sp. MWU13-2625]|nr:hypothetical protein C3E98_030070 [Pseudomonas sp. MWU13-2625]